MTADVRSAEVTQGPEWLVDFMADPPGWLLVVLVAIAVATIGLAALGWRRNDGLDRDVLEEMGQIGTIVFSILVCSQILSQSFDFSYAADVLAGTLVGFAIAQVFIWAFYQSRADDLPAAKS